MQKIAYSGRASKTRGSTRLPTSSAGTSDFAKYRFFPQTRGNGAIHSSKLRTIIVTPLTKSVKRIIISFYVNPATT